VIGLDFGFGALEAELWKLVFLMTRIGAALIAAPFFSAAAVPVQLRVGITAAIAVLVSALVGVALGFVLQLSFAAPVLAAEQIGGAMGMSIASSVDPSSGAHSPVLGQYYTVILTLIFLGLGGHLAFLRLVVDSYTALPPGAAWLGAERIGLIAGFASAVAIALPVTLILLLVQFATGVLSRSAPALNLFALGLPAGVLAGIAALIAAAPLTAEQFVALSEQGITQAAQVIAR
jgi:flagellar biosynthesis protein FliR